MYEHLEDVPVTTTGDDMTFDNVFGDEVKKIGKDLIEHLKAKHLKDTK